MTRDGCLLDVSVRALYVPPPLRAPVIAAEHRVRAGAATEVGLVMPGGQVVPAGESRSGPVRDFVMAVAGGLQPFHRRPVLLQLVVSVWHLNEARPHLLPKPGL